MRHHRSRRPLPALTTVAAAVVVAAGGIVLSPVAAADQPTLQCADGGFMCEGPGRFGSLSASYADDQPGPSVSWGTPTVTLLDSPADALDVEPSSEITRNYGIEIPSQASPDSPRRVSLLITNGTGLFAGPADMRFHITDEAGTELPAGTCTPEEQRLSPGERATVTCAVPDGGALLKAFRRGDFGGEYLAAWRLDSRTPPAPLDPGAPGTPPAVTVDGAAVTGTVQDGAWKATVPVTRRAPESNGADTTYAPEVTVDGAPVMAPSFRVTTRAAAPSPEPTPTPSASAAPAPEPSESPGVSAAPTDADASATPDADPKGPNGPAATSSGSPAATGSGSPAATGSGSPGKLARTGPASAGPLGAALLLTAAGAMALRRARRA
mgnify:FL=1